MNTWLRTITELSPWVFAPTVSVCWVLAAILVKRIAIRKLVRVTQKTAFQFDDLLVQAISKPLTLVIVASGILVMSRLLHLNASALRFFLIAFQLMTISAVVIFLDKILKSVTTLYRGQLQSVISPRVSQILIRTFLFSIASMVFLDMIGVSITPILASLGIGSLAVGLALQDTLSNFFSGIHLSIDKPIRIGDLVKLESGDEGFVTEIGWRSTRIRTGPNNLIIIPNQKLTSSTITNYFLPDREVAVVVQVGVDYGSDLERVERVALEVAREVMKKGSGKHLNFEPNVRFQAFGPSSINFAVTLRSIDATEQPVVKHEFIKALHARFQKDGIVIPYPHTTLDIPKESADALKSLVRT